MSAKDDANDDDPTEDQPGDDEPTEEPATETAASDDDQETAEEADEPEESAEPAVPEPAAAATTKAGTAATLESARAWVTTAPIWKVGLATALVAGVAAEIFGRLGQAAGAEMKTPPLGGDEAESIFIGGFIVAAIFNVVLGILLAMLLAWKASAPAKLWVIITPILTVLSFANPIMAENTTTPTKWVLALSHVVVAVIVIPTIYLRLAELERSKATQPEPA